VLEGSINNGIKHSDVPPYAVWMQSPSQLVVSKLSDMGVSQIIQRDVSDLRDKLVVGLLRNYFEFAAVR